MSNQILTAAIVALVLLVFYLLRSAKVWRELAIENGKQAEAYKREAWALVDRLKGNR